jgi:hypothetical protein
VLNRIAAMHRLAQARAASGPVEARSSYATAAGLLGELARGSVGTTSVRSGAQLHRTAAPSRGGSGSTAAAAAAPSSERVLSDIRALRAAAQNARRNGGASEAARLDRMAQQYAAASKAFFTAQLREALFAPAGSSGSIVIDNGDGNRAVPATSGRPRGGAVAAPGEPPAALPAENIGPTLPDADADTPPAAPPVDTVPAPPPSVLPTTPPAAQPGNPPSVLPTVPPVVQPGGPPSVLPNTGPGTGPRAPVPPRAPAPPRAPGTPAAPGGGQPAPGGQQPAPPPAQ